MLNRRMMLKTTGLMFAGAVAACSTTGSLTPTTVATDITLIADGLATTFANIQFTLPAAVMTALADLKVEAAAIVSAETTAAAQPIVQRVVTDVTAVATATLSLLPAGSSAITVIQAALALLPGLETAVQLFTAAKSGVAAGIAPNAARAILKSAAKK